MAVAAVKQDVTPQPIAKPKVMNMVKSKAPAKQVSSIAFPYVDMESAMTVGRVIHSNGGHAMTREQLAGALKQSVTSGAFVLKLSAARMFGLLENKEGKYLLTDLGFSVFDKSETREKTARAQAFLNVPLYKRLYDDFRNKQLPPRPLGLEQAILHLGVSPKQKATARLAFEKSARQAGYFNVDPDRLIEPIIGGGSSVAANSADLEPTQSAPTFYGGGGGTLDPLIQGMIERLPPAGEPWSAEKRKRWLQTFEANLEMIYPINGGSPGDGT